MSALASRVLPVLGLAVVACKPGPTTSPEPCPTVASETTEAKTDDAEVDPLVAEYEQALEIARYPTPDRVAEQLLVLDRNNADLTWNEAGQLLVTTWTKTEYYDKPEYVPGHAFPLYGETWFTSGTQVQDVCSASGLEGEALDLRVEQLLGLPPGGDSDAFMQVWIDPANLFRPCAEASVTATTCPVAEPLKSDAPDQVEWKCSTPADEHEQWLCNSWASRYGNSDPLHQYPWTALGYTYDWSPDNPTGQGPSEFVAPAKTKVVFEGLVPTGEFCAPAG